MTLKGLILFIQERIRSTSPYGHLPGWNVISLVRIVFCILAPSKQKFYFDSDPSSYLLRADL